MLIITVNADESRRQTFSNFVENNFSTSRDGCCSDAIVKNRNVHTHFCESDYAI